MGCPTFSVLRSVRQKVTKRSCKHLALALHDQIAVPGDVSALIFRMSLMHLLADESGVSHFSSTEEMIV